MTKGPKSSSERKAKLVNGHHENGGAAGAVDSPYTSFLPAEKDDDSYDVESGDEERHIWSRKMEYILTMVGYCVGLGNVWRFPYVCIRNGGGAFLIRFFICLVVCGMPLFFLEVTLGQFLSRGAFHVWSICPLFKGIGMSMNVLCVVCSWFYAIILAWTLIFVANSVKSPLPWTMCGQDWNTDFCTLPGNKSKIVSNSSLGSSANDSMLVTGGAEQLTSTLNVSSTLNVTRPAYSASEEFWLHNVLELSPGLEHFDGVPWHTAVALLIASIIVMSCIIKGVNSVGKVVYVTATLPYILLTVLIIKGATLPGAIDGVLFYIKPDFSKLLHIQTWVEASLQVFYSLGPSWGGLVTMASYNKFNNNCMRDAVVLSFVCEGTSFFAGFAIFTVLGHMAYTLDVPVSTFSSTGPGLAFVVYPEAISYLPMPQIWGVLFFIMLFTLGLDSQFTTIETTLTTISDLWPRFVSKWNLFFKIAFGVVLFLLSLPFAARGGMYLFQLVDWYIAAFTVCFNGVLECLIVGWIYGAERFMDDLQLMLGKRPPYLFAIFWRFCTPMMLTSVLISTLMTYQPPKYEGYTYDTLGVVIGWVIAWSSFLPIPVFAVYTLATGTGSFRQRLKTALTPSAEWQPSDPQLRENYRANCQQKSLFSFPLSCTRSEK